jgi:HD-GYP domain-containing protein (c-di-GMP phosphodiesterase class II)
MSRGAGRDLLAEERENVLSRALDTIPVRELEMTAACGIDTRRIMTKLLDALIARNDNEMKSARESLVEVADLLTQHGLSWSAVDGLSQALIASAFEHLDGKGESNGLGRMGSRLLRVQALLFESYLEAEENKRERLAQQLREIDGFPDTIAATLDPPTLTKVGLARLKSMLHMSGAAMYGLNAARKPVAVVGDLVAENGSLPRLELNTTAAFTLLQKREPYWEFRGEKSVAPAKSAGWIDSACVLLLPVVVRGRTTGVIILADGPDRELFTPEEIELAGRFVSRLAVALENAYLHEREQRKIKETVALLEITRAINSTLDLEQILEKVVQMTVDLCGVVMCAVYLYADDTGRFVPSAHYGFIEEGRCEDGGGSGIAVSGMHATQLEILVRGEPVFLTAAEASCLLPPELLSEHGVDTVFLFPLKVKERLSGVFALFYPCREAGDLEAEEVEVVRAIAAQASMAIENAALYEDIEKSYFSTVRALAKAIEVKDPYTHGHSERVTEYALLIADAMCLEEREKQKLKYAATLHDIGKIGIAGRVLNKPSDLTSEEYTHVKTHPILGESIVEPVEFLQGPRPIILHHHERYDGTGYPQGLKGSRIPLCARILSVADAFEAMRSDRPYRRALPLHKAIEELRHNAGSQFDPEVISVFLEIIEDYGGDPVDRRDT